MGILAWPAGNEDDDVKRYTVEHPDGYEYELIGSQDDVNAILDDSDREIVSEEPYDRPWWKLF